MNIALVLSGGNGSRIGGEIPKQYISVGKQMVITYCLKTLVNHPAVDAVWIVAEQGRQDDILAEVHKCHLDTHKFIGFSKPGKTRQLSILNGLRDICRYLEERPQEIGVEHVSDTWVLIHDAARPMLSSALLDNCFVAAAEDCSGVLPVLPMKDTIYYSESGTEIEQLLNRSALYAGQAPELFRLDLYLKANESLLPEEIFDINGSAEPAYKAGMKVIMIPGDESNFKITTSEDMERFREMMEK